MRSRRARVSGGDRGGRSGARFVRFSSFALVLALSSSSCTGGSDDRPADVAALRALVAASDLTVLATATGEMEGFPAEDPPRSLWSFGVDRIVSGGGVSVGDVVRVAFVGEPTQRPETFSVDAPAPSTNAVYLLVLSSPDDGVGWRLAVGGYYTVSGDKATDMSDRSDERGSFSVAEFDALLAGGR